MAKERQSRDAEISKTVNAVTLISKKLITYFVRTCLSMPNSNSRRVCDMLQLVAVLGKTHQTFSDKLKHIAHLAVHR